MKTMWSSCCCSIGFLPAIIVLIASFASFTALAADPPDPRWSRDGCNVGFKFCSNVTTKESWSKDGNNIYFFLDVVVDGVDLDRANTTVWYVGDNFDADWAEDLSKESFNVVRFSPRGSEFAYPKITCDPNYYSRVDHCVPNASCAEEIAKSGLDMSHYSMTETANDLLWVMKTLGAGKLNIIVSEGFGNFVVQRLLSKEVKLENVSVIMAGFTHPEYFDAYTSVGGYDGALQRLLEFCEEDDSLLCVYRVGAMEGLWNRVINVMKAAKANTLRCNRLLDWGVDPKDMHIEYRNILATLLKKPQNFFMLSEWRLVQLVPSFIYRLQRCGPHDQDALNRLYSYINSEELVRCPLSVPQRYNWLVNELILTRPPVPPAEFLDEISHERLVLPSLKLWQRFYDMYTAFPKYNSTPFDITAAGVPLLLLASDIDPVFPLGTAAMASNTYSGTLRLLPHQSSFPVATSARNCIKENLITFRSGMKWATVAKCAQDKAYKLDFIKFDAYSFYGVSDAWEFTLPNMPEPTGNTPRTTTTAAPYGPDPKNCSDRAVNVLTVFFLLAMLGLGGMSYLLFKTRRSLVRGSVGKPNSKRKTERCPQWSQMEGSPIAWSAMNTTQKDDDDTTAAPQPSKRAMRYSGEMVKLLSVMDRTPSSNWNVLSTVLSQLLKCIESNIEAAGEVVPDPVLMCRVIWKCFDPKGVMGVHRKALEVLQRLCVCIGTAQLIREMPLLLVGVLELLPQCSIQLKCELLEFVEVHMLRALPPAFVAMELSGILAGVLTGLEENETSDVYRSTLQVMENIHTLLNIATVETSVTTAANVESEGKMHEKSVEHNSTAVGKGDQLVYATLWLTLNNCPPLRNCVLLYMKLRLGREAALVRTGSHASFTVGSVDTTAGEVKEGGFVSTSIKSSDILAGDLHIVHSAIFATLQEPSERKQRLMLDVLIAALPLGDQKLFTFHKRSWLVAAVIQLLGFPDVKIGIRRRIATWLMGPNPEKTSTYLQDVSSFLVAQAFHGVVLWWNSHFAPSAVKDTRAHCNEMSPQEESYYQVLFTSACKHCHALNDFAASTNTEMNLTEACVMPTVWLRAFINLFRHVFTSDRTNEGDEDDNDIGSTNTNNNTEYSNEYGSADRDNARFFEAYNDSGSAKVTGNPFVEYVEPLVMPVVCDLLVSMGLWKRECTQQSTAIDSILSALFGVVSWDYFTRYEHDLVAVLEQCLEGLRGVASTGVGEDSEVTQRGLDMKEVAKKSASNGSHAKLLLDLEICYQRLIGLATVVETHVVELMDQNMERTLTFLQGMFTTNKSLCSIVCGTCEMLLTQDSTGNNTTHFSIAQTLIKVSLESFNFIFFGTFTALQEQVELTGENGVLRENEAVLLNSMMCGSVAMTQFVLRGHDNYGETLARLNDTVFSLLLRSSHSDGKSSSHNDFSSGVCTETLEKWVDSVFSMANSTCLVVQQHAFQLYMDLLNSVAPPQKLPVAVYMQELTGKLLPHLWELLGTCGTELQPQVVELLVRLYATQKGRVILDELTSVASRENGERVLLLFRLLDEKKSLENVFQPAIFMMLQALDGRDASLRWLAQSMVRQSLPCFQHILSPLVGRLAKYFMLQDAVKDDAVAEPMECNASESNSHTLQEQKENTYLNPMEFVRLVKSILTIPAFLSPLLNRLHMTQLPEDPITVMTAAMQRHSVVGKDESEHVDMPLGSFFAILSYLLLEIVRRSLRLQDGGMGSYNTLLQVELCTEATETLNVMLEGTLSLPNPPETVVHTWHYISLHVMDLLREVIQQPSFSMIQILLLQLFLNAVRFLNTLDPATAWFTHDVSGHSLATEASQMGDSAPVMSNTEQWTSRTCIMALQMQNFYDTVEAGVEKAVATALTSSWASHDFLSVWCNTLLELLPYFHERRGEASGHLLKVFLKVMNELMAQSTSLAEAATARVVEKCLNGIYGILKYHFTAEKLTGQNHTAGKRNGWGWFAFRVPSLGGDKGTNGSGILSITQKAAGSDAVCMETFVRDSIHPVLSMLCKLHCVMHRIHAPPGVSEEQQSRESHERLLVSHAENVIHCLLQLYTEEVGTEFYKAFIDVWSAGYEGPLSELFTPSKPAPLVQETNSHKSPLLLLNVSNDDTTMLSSSPLSDQEMIARLLNTGTKTTVLPLICIFETLLIKQRSSMSSTSAASSSSQSMEAKMPFDVAVFHFLHIFLATCHVSPDEAQEILNALIGFATMHISQGSPSVLCLPLILRVLAHFVSGQFLLNSPSSSCASGEEVYSLEWGKDKRCSQIVCKALDAFAVMASQISSMQGELLFAFNILAEALPALACSALLEQDRIANAILNLYKRSLLPTVMFGINSETNADVCARTPLLKAALSVIQTIVKFGDAVSRRIRQELLDTLSTCDFFHLQQSVIHEWSLVFEWLSQDRTFHADVVQLFKSSSFNSNRILSLMTSAEEEERQRVRQTNRLAFYVTCIPPAILRQDREFSPSIRKYIVDSLRTFYSTVAGNVNNKRDTGFSSARRAVFLFRVLLTKLDPALLHPFWPIVLPAVLRALSLPLSTGDTASADNAAGKATEEELLALQMECLKLLDFLLVIVPDTFAPFRWVFFDDLDAAANVIVSSCNAKEIFMPIVRRLAPHSLSPAVCLHDVWKLAVSTSTSSIACTGLQRPLLRFSPLLYGKLRGIGACAEALSLFSRSVDFVESSETEEQLFSVASTRLIDGWDEVYVRALLETDFSCILEENTF